MSRDKADEFLEEQSERNPDYWELLAEMYTVNTPYDEDRFDYGEPPKRRRNREGKKGGVPKSKKRNFSDKEWAETQEAKRKYYREWEEDFRYAKELADDGM